MRVVSIAVDAFFASQGGRCVVSASRKRVEVNPVTVLTVAWPWNPVGTYARGNRVPELKTVDRH